MGPSLDRVGIVPQDIDKKTKNAVAQARFRIGVDVGGTFTDVIRHDTETGAVEVAKTASTPPDFIDGMLAGIEAVGAEPGDIKLIKIGTTIATNTVIMRTGARAESHESSHRFSLKVATDSHESSHPFSAK